MHAVPLTPLGIAQARAAGAALAEVEIDRVITTGLRRTQETAEGVLGTRSIPRETESRLREIEPGRFSEWAGAPAEVVRQFLLGSLSERLSAESAFLNGETIGACQRRIEEAWNELLGRSDWATVVVVAHNIVNRLILAHCLGLPLGGLTRIEQDAGCINLIEIDEAGQSLVRVLNFTMHDPSKRTLRLTTLETLFEQYLRGQG